MMEVVIIGEFLCDRGGELTSYRSSFHSTIS